MAEQARPPDLDEHGNPIAAGARPPDLDEHGNPIAPDALGKAGQSLTRGGALSELAAGAWRNTNPMGVLHTMKTLATDPAQAGKDFLDPIVDQGRKAKAAYGRGEYGSAAGHALGMTPFVGPPVAHGAEEIAAGNVWRGIGEIGSLGVLGYGAKKFGDMANAPRGGPPAGPGASIDAGAGGGFSTGPKPVTTGTNVPPPRPAGTLPWTARVPAGPEPPPVTGTGSAVTPPAGAGTQPWSTTIPTRPQPPPVTGTGSVVGAPPTEPAQPWTAQRPPAAPSEPAPAPMATGTGNAAGGGPVSWGNWRPPATESAPIGNAAGADPMAGAPITIKSLTPRELPAPDVELGGFTEKTKHPTPAVEPLQPVKPQPADAGPAGELDLQNTLGARDAAARLGVDANELRDRTGQRGKAPSAAMDRINAAIDKMTPEQMQSELTNSKNPKLVERIKARLAGEEGMAPIDLFATASGAKALWELGKGAVKAGQTAAPYVQRAAQSPWTQQAMRAAMLAELANAGQKKD